MRITFSTLLAICEDSSRKCRCLKNLKGNLLKQVFSINNSTLQDLQANRTVAVGMREGIPYLYKTSSLFKRSLIQVSREPLQSLYFLMEYSPFLVIYGCFSPSHMVLALRKNSPGTELVNYVCQQAVETGLMGSA